LDAGICSGDAREWTGALGPDVSRGLSGYADSAVVHEQSGTDGLAGVANILGPVGLELWS